MDGPDEKQFHTTVRGHALQRHTRADDGRVTYTVSRWDQSRAFSHWHDVQAFLVQVGGAAPDAEGCLF